MNDTENLQQPPKAQTKSSPFWLMLLGVPAGFVFAVLAVILVNYALPVADADRFKSLIFGGSGGAGLGATLLGAFGFISRSLKMTDGKIANNTPSLDVGDLALKLALDKLGAGALIGALPLAIPAPDEPENLNIEEIGYNSE